MNWTTEKQKLETQTTERPQHPWFNPEIGQTYQVTITEDVDESNYYENVYNGEKRKKLRVPIKVEDKEQNWGISVGKTPSSLYGQLIYLFEHWQSLNQPINAQVIHLEVTAQDDLAAKKKRKFRIREAVALITAQEKPTPQTDKAKADFQTEQPPTIKSQAVETEGA